MISEQPVVVPDYYKEVFKWAKASRLFRNENENQNPSHNILNGYKGGLLFITPENEADFITKYVEDVIERRYIHYFSENRTVVFKMYCDIDLKRFRGGPATDEEILNYCKVICETVRKFYPVDLKSEYFHCIVLKSPIKETTEEGERPTKQWKSGIHLVWPYLEVTQFIALYMRGAIIDRLIYTFGNENLENVQQNSWDDIIDERVYTTNGLRMPYSHKCDICPECKAREDRIDNCGTCTDGMNGRVDSGRPYSTWKYLIGGTHSEEHYQTFIKNIYDAIALMSIRTHSTEPTVGWEPYKGAPAVPAVADPAKQIITIDKNGKQYREFSEDVEAIKTIRSKVHIPRTDTIYELIERFIQIQTENEWKYIKVYNIFTNEKKTWYQIQVRGEGSSYCLNYNKDHNSNHIYFLIRPEGLVQKCYCRCKTTTNRIMGMCEEFQSKVYKLTKNIKARLWSKNAELGILAERLNDCMGRNPDGFLASVCSVVYSIASQIESDDETNCGILPGSENSLLQHKQHKGVFSKVATIDDLNAVKIPNVVKGSNTVKGSKRKTGNFTGPRKRIKQ